MVSTPIFESISMMLIGLILITIPFIIKKKNFKRRLSYLFLLHRVLLAVFMVYFFVNLVFAYSVKLGWNPNSEPDLKGYVLYGSAESPCSPYDEIGIYPESKLPNPLNPAVRITDLEKDVRYYFVVTAYDTSGLESDSSSVLSVLNGKGANTTCSSVERSSGGGSGSGGGGGGGG